MSSASPSAPTVTVHVCGPLRTFCGGASRIALEAADVRAALATLEREHAHLYIGVCDETGAVRRHINLFVNESHVRDLAGLDTRFSPGDELTILPAVSGG